LHYTLIQMYIHDQENKISSEPEPGHSINNATPEMWDAAYRGALRDGQSDKS